MAWNEPGGNKDPWGRKPQNNNEIDNILKDLTKYFKTIIGGSGNSGQTANGKNSSLLAIAIVVIYMLSGIYIVNDGERGVVLQFGEFHSITMPGPHWVPRIIRNYEIVDVSKIRSVQQKAVMLTQDENIVSVNFAIQYDVKDAANFLFNLRDPDTTLRAAGESSIREVMGKNRMDYIITNGREAVASETKTLLQNVMDEYKSGINVQTVNILDKLFNSTKPQKNIKDKIQKIGQKILKKNINEINLILNKV